MENPPKLKTQLNNNESWQTIITVLSTCNSFPCLLLLFMLRY